jgi:hypothetical protein
MAGRYPQTWRWSVHFPTWVQHSEAVCPATLLKTFSHGEAVQASAYSRSIQDENESQAASAILKICEPVTES